MKKTILIIFLAIGITAQSQILLSSDLTITATYVSIQERDTTASKANVYIITDEDKRDVKFEVQSSKKQIVMTINGVNSYVIYSIVPLEITDKFEIYTALMHDGDHVEILLTENMIVLDNMSIPDVVIVFEGIRYDYEYNRYDD